MKTFAAMLQVCVCVCVSICVPGKCTLSNLDTLDMKLVITEEF